MSTADVSVPTTLTRDSASTIRKQSGPRLFVGRVWWRHTLGVLALVWALFPIVFIYSAATNAAGTLNSASLLPSGFSLANLDQLLNDPARPYATWYKNSMLIALAGALATVFIGATAAYAFSRLRFRGRRPGMLALLLLQMFPALLAFTALYITFAKIGDVLPQFGLNTKVGLLLAYLGGAMGSNVWLLKGYFDTIPKELDEAARVDGASHARIFFTMTLRLAVPILVTVFMVQFVALFGEFMLALIFLTDVDNQTLGVGLYSMSRGIEANRFFGQFAMGALLASLPVMALYLGFQKQLVGGLTQGSVK
jgi:arabinogalactan oligomer/maltooligosaccharide transport system permease protein